MTEEKYPINYNDEYHSLRIIPEGMPIYNVKDNVKNLNGRSTWHHWQLIPTSRPVINPAPFKANFISIPGGNGSIDASTVLTNYPTYEDRSGSIEFKSIRDYGSPKGWVRTYELIQNYLHGRRFKVILYDDPLFYYQGRMTVNAWKSDKDWSTITLDYRFDPFKYWVGSDDWNEEHYSNIVITGTGFKTANYRDSRTFNHASLTEYKLEQYGLPNDVGWTMPVSPEIIVEAQPYATVVEYIPHYNERGVLIGNPTPNSSYTYTVLSFKNVSTSSNPITATITGRVGAGSSDKVRLWAWLDDGYNVLTKANIDETTASQPKTITAPDNAKFLVVNSWVSESHSVVPNAELDDTFYWDDGYFIPVGLEIAPSSQSPSCIKFVQFAKNGTTIKGEASYEFTDTNQHSVNAYGILFNNDETIVRAYASPYQKFKFSYRFKRGLL